MDGPGVYSIIPGVQMKILILKESFVAIKERYLLEPATKENREAMYQEFRILFDEFDLKDFLFFIKQNKYPHTIEIIPVRTIDKWAMRGILFTDDEDIK